MSSKLGKTITKMTSKQFMEKYFMLNEQQSTSTKQKYVCKLYHHEWSEEESYNATTKKTFSKGAGNQWALQHLQWNYHGKFELEMFSSQMMLIQMVQYILSNGFSGW
jgi:hypothetical protein